MIWCGGLSHSNEMMWWAAGKLGAKSNGLLNEALCKKVMSDLLKTSAPAQHPLWGYRHRVRIMFQGGKQGSAARAGLYLIIADVSLKSLRSSYTGLCLQTHPRSALCYRQLCMPARQPCLHVQGYLAHKKLPTPLGLSEGPGHSPAVGS